MNLPIIILALGGCLLIWIIFQVKKEAKELGVNKKK